MKIKSIRIENFRSFKDQTIFLDDYTCFVGPNGAGKSTIFYALNIFFRQYKDSNTDLSKLSESDFHHKNRKKNIKITVTFHDLSKQAKIDFADYVRQDNLIITAIATFDPSTERAEVKQFGSRLGIDNFRKFFEAEKEGKKVNELKDIFKSFQNIFVDLPKATSKAEMIKALKEYEASHPENCKIIPSEDQFYGATRGTNKLEKHIQWVFVSASKDVSEEGEESKTSALGQLLARTVRSKVSFDKKVNNLRIDAKKKYQKLLDAEQSSLQDISNSLQNRLASWAHPNLSAQVLWKQDPDKSIKIEEPLAYIKIGERGFEGDLSRFGHGLQRSYLLALLQELASSNDENAPTLIMGLEEPEIYQHPPQAKYLAETIVKLSEKESQILLCTHNPLFIPGDNFDKIRIVRENGNPSQTIITSICYKELAKKLQQNGKTPLKESGMVAKLYPSLNPVINEMFFCKVLILVEGQEDVAYITSYLMLTEKIVEFRKYGCHIVPVDGKNRLIKPLAIAKILTIPTKVIFDGDTSKDQITNEVNRNSEVSKHKMDNKAILELQDLKDENEWPTNHIIHENLCCWKTNLTDTIKTKFGEKWQIYKDQASAYYDNAGDLEKNPLAIAKTLELAWKNKIKSKTLIDLVDRIIEFARNSTY